MLIQFACILSMHVDSIEVIWIFGHEDEEEELRILVVGW